MSISASPISIASALDSSLLSASSVSVISVSSMRLSSLISKSESLSITESTTDESYVCWFRTSLDLSYLLW